MHAELLRLFHLAMPGVAGVVLATAEGLVRAHDVGDAARARRLAAEGLAAMPRGESALVPLADRLYLVVRVPEA